MLKRRDSGSAPENSEAKETKQPQKNYSVSIYVSVFFVAVIVVILISYFGHSKTTSETINSLTAQHDKFSMQALENIEELQNRNIQLAEEKEELEDRLEELEEENLRLANLMKKVEDGEENGYNVLIDNETAAGLLDVRLLLDAGDEAAAREAFEKIDGEAAEKYIEEYERLKELFEAEE